MAFEPKDRARIKEALNTTTEKTKEIKKVKDSTVVSVPVYNQDNEQEKTKSFVFTMQPSVRKKLNEVAKEHNYKSASRFLNELIKNL